MPQDVDFGLPWSLRVNPHLSSVREHNLEWMQRFGLLSRDDRAVTSYLEWRLAEVAAYFYPEASAEDLDLAANLMGWYFAPFDDQFDGPLGEDPEAVAAVCDTFITALHHPVGDSAAPSVAAFGDIWERCRAGMSSAWRARAICNWTDYFAVHVAESQLRRGGLALNDSGAHIWRRRRSNGAFVVNDMAERVSGFEVPPVIWHHQIINEMREIAADVVTLSQDTASVEKEEMAGDRRNNFLLIVESDNGLSRTQAIGQAQRRTEILVRRFQELEKSRDDLVRLLPLEQRDCVSRYVQHLRDWMKGHDAWACQSSRYDIARDRVRAAQQRLL